MARQYNNYSDIIDFTRASSGTALTKVSYGEELVTNGTFDSDSDWTLFGGATISGGVLTVVSDGSGVGASKNILTVGKVYNISVDVVVRSGTCKVQLGSGSQTPFIISSSGSYTFARECDGTDGIFFLVRNNSCDVDFDNVSVKEVTFGTGALTLFNHPVNVPRVEYDADGNRLGLLVEEPRTNLLPYSEDFSNAAWSKTRGDITAESIEDPTGQQNAFSWTANDSLESYVDEAATITSGSTVTFSAFIKKKTADYCHLLVWDSSANGCRVWFDLINGQVGADTAFGSTFVVSSSAITESANGWYRCSMTVTTSGTTTAISRLHPSNGNGDINSSAGKSIYIYGAQLEQGSFPTSYIPTSGSTVTRSADIASIDVADFGYNQSEGTVVAEVNIPNASKGGKRLLSLSGGNTSNRIDLLLLPTNPLMQLFVVDGGVNQVAEGTTNAYQSGQNEKFAASYGEDDYAAVLDGGDVILDANGSVPAVTSLMIGNSPINQKINGHIRSIKYYPRRLTNDQLVELTS